MTPYKLRDWKTGKGFTNGLTQADIDYLRRIIEGALTPQDKLRDWKTGKGFTNGLTQDDIDYLRRIIEELTK